MTTLSAALPRSAAVLEEGIERGVHVGAQIHVALAGKEVTSDGVGLAAPGVAMTPESMMIWFSSTKAVTSVAAARVWESGAFDLDDPVSRHLPEFAANGKEAVTIRHLFTHTAGLRFADRAGGGPLAAYEDALAAVCASPLEEGWVPGRRAGYHGGSGMLLLAELVHRADGRPFSQYVREEIFEPLGMPDCWIGMPRERHAAYGDRIGVMHNTEGAEPRPLPLADSAEACERVVPGGNGRGPMAQLGRFYEMLRRRGELDGVRIVSPQALEAMTTRQRTGMKDDTFGIPIDWGLGLILKSFLYGRHASSRVFGHGGARSSVAFCDPEHGLVMALVCNGMPKPQDHYARQLAITGAVYEDLGLAQPDAADPLVPAIGQGLV